MAKLLLRLQLSWHQALACVLWALMGVLLAAALLASLPVGWADGLLMLLIAMALVYAGTGYAFDLPGAHVVVALMSLLAILYAVALVLLGTEDVGGFGISVPVALALVVFASYNLLKLTPSARPTRAEQRAAWQVLARATSPGGLASGTYLCSSSSHVQALQLIPFATKRRLQVSRESQQVTEYIWRVVGFVLVAVWIGFRISRARDMVSKWAIANGLTVLKRHRTFFRLSPWPLTGLGYQAMRYLSVRDPQGHVRRCWLLLGNFWWGLTDSVQVVWEK